MNKEKLEKILDAQDYNLNDYNKFISIKIDTSKDINYTKKSLISFIKKKVLHFDYSKILVIKERKLNLDDFLFFKIDI